MGEPNPNKKCAKELAAVINLLHESSMTHSVWCWYFSIPFIFKLCCTNSVFLCLLLLWLHNISLNTLAHTFSQHSTWHRKTLNPSEFPECWSFSCFYGKKKVSVLRTFGLGGIKLWGGGNCHNLLPRLRKCSFVSTFPIFQCSFSDKAFQCSYSLGRLNKRKGKKVSWHCRYFRTLSLFSLRRKK